MDMFQYTCTQITDRNGTITYSDTTENVSVIVGPFEPGFEVVCDINAANGAGQSPNSTATYFLPCIREFIWKKYYSAPLTTTQ